MRDPLITAIESQLDRDFDAIRARLPRAYPEESRSAVNLGMAMCELACAVPFVAGMADGRQLFAPAARRWLDRVVGPLHAPGN